jgi:hypothetical protein
MCGDPWPHETVVIRTGETPDQRAAIPAARVFEQIGGSAEASVNLFLLLNAVVKRNIRAIEMIGVLMRIFSFSLVSWLGPSSPFLFVWAFNTTDAVLLAWCAILKRDRAYTVLNVFWVGVGIIGMIRAAGFAAH